MKISPLISFNTQNAYSLKSTQILTENKLSLPVGKNNNLNQTMDIMAVNNSAILSFKGIQADLKKEYKGADVTILEHEPERSYSVLDNSTKKLLTRIDNDGPTGARRVTFLPHGRITVSDTVNGKLGTYCSVFDERGLHVLTVCLRKDGITPESALHTSPNGDQIIHYREDGKTIESQELKQNSRLVLKKYYYPNGELKKVERYTSPGRCICMEFDENGKLIPKST